MKSTDELLNGIFFEALQYLIFFSFTISMNSGNHLGTNLRNLSISAIKGIF
jgi:hypothetical protein